MIHIYTSKTLQYDKDIAANFDKTRQERLFSCKNEAVRNEIYTSGLLIDAIHKFAVNNSVEVNNSAVVEETEYKIKATVKRPLCMNDKSYGKDIKTNVTGDISKALNVEHKEDYDNCGFIKYNEYGRPYFADSLISFNVTHSNGRVLAAFSADQEVGIDYEASERRINASLKKKLCNLEDLIELERYCCSYDYHLLRLFTMKEAVSKLYGKGLLMDFRSIYFERLLDAKVSVDDNSIQNTLKVYKFEIKNDDMRTEIDDEMQKEIKNDDMRTEIDDEMQKDIKNDDTRTEIDDEMQKEIKNDDMRTEIDIEDTDNFKNKDLSNIKMPAATGYMVNYRDEFGFVSISSFSRIESIGFNTGDRHP